MRGLAFDPGGASPSRISTAHMLPSCTGTHSASATFSLSRLNPIFLMVDEFGFQGMEGALHGHCRGNRLCGSSMPACRRVVGHLGIRPRRIGHRDRNDGSSRRQGAGTDLGGHRADRATTRINQINRLPLVILGKRPPLRFLHPTPPSSPSLLHGCPPKRRRIRPGTLSQSAHQATLEFSS